METGGRLVGRDGDWSLGDARGALALVGLEGFGVFVEGELIRLQGVMGPEGFRVEAVESLFRPAAGAATPVVDPGVLVERGQFLAELRSFFQRREFSEVETPYWVSSPGTDPYLEPVEARFQVESPLRGVEPGFLHTSPEFAMKRLLAAGAGPVFQLARVWRNGERSALHNPEFTLLEWYRPWEAVERIIEDVEELVCEVLGEDSARVVGAPIRRMTMAEVVDEACGFDLMEALELEALRDAVESRGLLGERHLRAEVWEELFFALMVERLDPFVAGLGAVFVTEWPTALAALARRKPGDPRVAERFELYVDGVELANGFGELTDPEEQRARFEADNRARAALGKPELPMAEELLAAMEWGLPPSSGVALGVDRLMMLARGNERIDEVWPWAL